MSRRHRNGQADSEPAEDALYQAEPCEERKDQYSDPAEPGGSLGSVKGEDVMNTNVGSIDRVVRVVLGLGLLSVVFLLEGSVRWIGLIGLVPLLTGIFSFCPLYTVLGIRTCSATPQRP